MMRRILFLAVVCLSFYSVNAQRQVILILADDLGWKDVAYNGSSYYDTPNLDKLANSSLNFTNAYANASNCAPSRACLMTGQYTPRHKVYTVAPSARGDVRSRKIIPTPTSNVIPEDAITLGHLFQNAGYVTGVFGKWHIGQDPTKQGFDVHKGGGKSGHPKTYFSPYQLQFLEDGPKGEYLTDRITQEAIGFMEANKEKDFFMYLPHFAIHTPLQGKEEDKAFYADKTELDGQGGNKDYAAMVKNLDDNVGKVLDAVKVLGLKDPLIIFSSDNGGIASLSRQWPLRAGKGSYYEGGIRVPMLVNHSSIKAAKSDDPVLLFDLFPTLCDWSNLNNPTNHTVDGLSMIDILEGKPNTDRIERPLFFHFPFYLEAYNVGGDDSKDDFFRTRPGSVVRVGKWKLHHYFEDGELELYDLNNDLGERINLAQSNPKKADELYKVLDKWRNEVNAPVPTALNPEYEEGFVPVGRKRK
ncbi:Arylsulfatase A [Spirosomataceae bacterium TFI 002]|nr:Arylsulfatase A [Spirosomataceae bacterium TFI 002]